MLIQQLKSSKFWLPRNLTWEDVYTARDGLIYPDGWMLVYRLIPAIGIAFALREFFIRCIFTKVAIRLKISTVRSRKAPLCDELEDVYVQERANAMRVAGRLKQISGQIGLTEVYVYNWFKIRRLQDEVPDLDKFVEDCWMALYTTALSTLGLYILKDDPVVINLDAFWVEYPFHSVRVSQELFYIAGIAMFVVDSFALITKGHETIDPRLRVYHHVLITLILIVSWLSNEIRLGTLILFMLDSCTPFAYTAKVTEWLSWSKTSRFLFGCCMFHWFFVRTLWLHIVAIPSIFVYRYLRVGLVPAYILFDVMLAQLTVVNFIWIRIISSKVLGALHTGKFFKRTLDEKAYNEVAHAIKAMKNNNQKIGKNKLN